MDGSVASFKFQVGEGSGQTLTVAISDMDSTALAVNTSAEDLLSRANATAAITDIDTAIETVSTERGKLGAVSNRLTSTMNNLDKINCFSNEGEGWNKTITNLIGNELVINFSDKFNFRRGRINCSLKDEIGWRWLGLQFTIKQD